MRKLKLQGGGKPLKNNIVLTGIFFSTPDFTQNKFKQSVIGDKGDPYQCTLPVHINVNKDRDIISADSGLKDLESRVSLVHYQTE